LTLGIERLGGYATSKGTALGRAIHIKVGIGKVIAFGSAILITVGIIGKGMKRHQRSLGSGTLTRHGSGI
jgi:hypothetical protein